MEVCGSQVILIDTPIKFIEILRSMEFKPGSINEMIKILITENLIIFHPTTSEEIAKKINERFGKSIEISQINGYMKIFQKAGVVMGHSVRDGKFNRKIWLGSWVPKENFVSDFKNTVIPLSKELVSELGDKFNKEVKDLRLVYGKSGDCTAFILRKILEKSIFLAFANNKMIDKLKDPSKSPRFHSLGKMINVASVEKGADGTPYITPNTASKLGGIKFLGDTASHNFLENIKSDDIPHQMPYITVALGELTKKF